VVFDFGGVIISPITEKLAQIAARHAVSMEQMLEVLMGPRHESTVDHPWHRAERGEVAVADLQELVVPYAEAAGMTLSGDEVDVLFEQTYRVNAFVVERIVRLREQGYRTGLLTNSMKEFRPSLARDVDLGLFDVVVDSSEVGARKPEPAIYERMTAALGVPPSRIVYLDDFEDNLVGADAAGWTVVHVRDAHTALVELDELLGPDHPSDLTPFGDGGTAS
jgi:epoxide hydrolase-like predicted phosphatase